MAVSAAASVLGGPPVLGGNILSDLDLLEAVHEGLPTSAIDSILDQGFLSPDEVHLLIMSPEAYRHRRETGTALTREESDRLARVARVMAMAGEVFEDAQKAAHWLRKPNRGLGGHVPLQLLVTGEGAGLVQQTLLKITHGAFA
jgi:putative toxin-antitoxin system antitoxin component (TIGR02293 family)